MFSCEFYEIFKETFFLKHLRTAVSDPVLRIRGPEEFDPFTKAAVYLQDRCLCKFRKTHRETPVPSLFFNKVAGLKLYTP